MDRTSNQLSIGGAHERNFNETACQVYAAGLRMYAEVVIGKKSGRGAGREPMLLPGVMDRLFDFYIDESSVELFSHDGHLALNRKFFSPGTQVYHLFQSQTAPSFRLRRIVLDALKPVLSKAFQRMVIAKERTDSAIKGSSEELGFWKKRSGWFDHRSHEPLVQRYALVPQFTASGLGVLSQFFMDEDLCAWGLSTNINLGIPAFNVPRLFLDDPKFERLESFTPFPVP